MIRNKQLLVKICVGILCAITALILPLFIISPDRAILTVKHFGLWGMLGTFLLFLNALRSPMSSLNWSGTTQAIRAHLPAIIAILAATVYLHFHLDRGFKILFDEYTINSTAMGLHFDGRAYALAATHIIDGEIITGTGFVDKRPIFFPFAVSILHRLTGFRAENVFWLNSTLTFLLLGLLYRISAQACGKRHGILAVLLLTSLPLLAQNTTGGGYEIMNLCLIAALILSATHYMRTAGARGLNLLILTAILLANNRYESITYVAVPAVLFLLKSSREKRMELTWFSVFSPLLLILPLLSYAVFQADARFIQTTNENFFSLDHLGSNLAHATAYLFEATGDYSNSLLLSAVGIPALVLLAVYLIRNNSALLKKDIHLVAASAVFLVTFANTTLALSCYWGAWTDPATSRFSLPLQFFFALAAPCALYRCFGIRRPPVWLLGLCLLFIPLATSPNSIRLSKETRMVTVSGNDWAIDWVRSHTNSTDNYIIADSCIGFGLYRYPTLPIQAANQMPEQVLQTKELGLYEDIFAVEAFFYHPQAHRFISANPAPLSSRFVLETVAQNNFYSNFFYRISRITGLRPTQPDEATEHR